MPGQTPLTRKLIADGCKADRPMRSLSELLAEHRELVAVGKRIRARCQALRLDPTAASALDDLDAILKRCEAPTADRSVA